MGYGIHNGRIQTWALEAHIVDHCNLRCVHCCTLSPQLAPRVVEPSSLARDLTALAPVLAPQAFKLTGGEPLLHPHITECLQVARESAIAPVLQVTTNGFLAPRMPDEFWRALDRICVSLYPSAPLPDATLGLILQRCETFDVELRLKPAPRFQRMDALTPHADATEVFRDCWLRHRCHMVRDGRFYLCTRPPHLADVHGRPQLADEGVELRGEQLQRRLLEYLTAETPLESCRFCTGSTGELEEHRQLETARASRPVS